MPTVISGTTGVSLVEDASITASKVITGFCVQRVEATPMTTYTSSSNLYVGGDVIPTTASGFQACSLSITPKSATNRLAIRGNVVASGSSSGTLVVSLHKDAVAAAFAATKVDGTIDAVYTIPIVAEMVAGSISPITFRLYMHAVGSGSIFSNGNSGGRKLGGVSFSSLSVEEYVA